MGAGDVVRFGEEYLSRGQRIAKPPFLRRGARRPRKRRSAARGGRVGSSPRSRSLAAFGLCRFLGGSLFALRRFEISGNARARTEDILTALAPWSGSNLVALDLAPLAARLAAHPWIERVTLSKRFPDGLSVRDHRAAAPSRCSATARLFWWLGARRQPDRALRSARATAPST